ARAGPHAAARRADQPRTAGHPDRPQRPRVDAGVLEHHPYGRQDLVHVRPGRHLRVHAAVPVVQRNLGRGRRGGDRAVLVDERDRGVVTGRLDPENQVGHASPFAIWSAGTAPTRSTAGFGRLQFTSVDGTVARTPPSSSRSGWPSRWASTCPILSVVF